jgi:hemoglobin-like flavoprotein
MKVISAVGMAVEGLNDLEKLVPKLKGLGQMHVGKGVLPEHYAIVGQALIMALKEGHLKDEWNEGLEKAWIAIY